MRIHGRGLSITVVWREDTVVLFLAGNADHRSAPLLSRTLDALTPQRVTNVWVDLAGVDQLDDAGANTLLQARQRISARGHVFVLRSPLTRGRATARITHPRRARTHSLKRQRSGGD